MGANIVVRTDGLEEDKKEGKRERKKTKEEGAVTVLIHTSLRALKRIASCAHCLSACCLPSCLPACLYPLSVPSITLVVAKKRNKSERASERWLFVALVAHRPSFL